MKLNKKEINSLLPKERIQREMYNNLKRHIEDKEEVTILYGARQVGKSTLTLSCLENIINAESTIFYFNLDDDLDDFINEPKEFIRYIKANRKGEEKVYIFIDEAQRLESIGLFVKYIYDQKLNFKFMLTGSASLDIQSKVKEALTGRKKEFYLSALTLREKLTYNGIGIDKIEGFFPQLEDLLKEYMLYGGYPQVEILNYKDDKEDKLKEISSTYLLKDLTRLFKIENKRNVILIGKFLAENIGNIVSIDGICKYTGISRYDVEKIVNALEQTYTITLLYPFYRDKSKELVHAPKVYFNDNGIRNALLSKLDEGSLIIDKGQLFENTIFNQLKSKYEEINYWKTQNQTEVDFVVSKRYMEILALETKYFYKKDSIPKSLGSFLNQYKDDVKEFGVVSKENYWKYI